MLWQYCSNVCSQPIRIRVPFFSRDKLVKSYKIRWVTFKRNSNDRKTADKFDMHSADSDWTSFDVEKFGYFWIMHANVANQLIAQPMLYYCNLFTNTFTILFYSSKLWCMFVFIEILWTHGFYTLIVVFFNFWMPIFINGFKWIPIQYLLYLFYSNFWKFFFDLILNELSSF